MIDIDIWKIRRAIRKLEKRYAREIAANSGDADEREFDKLDFYRARGGLEREIDQRLTGRLLSEAQTLRIPTPRYTQDSPDWFQDERGTLSLRPAAFKALRDSIRDERKARFDVASRWVTLLTGIVTLLTGLVGALIGLVAVWKRH